MKIVNRIMLAFFVLILIVPMVGKAAPPRFCELSFAEGSTLSLAGDSTLHAYESEANTLILESAVDMAGVSPSVASTELIENAVERARINKLVLTIPVKDIRSHVVGLSGAMHKALKFKEYPDIVFELDNYDLQKDATDPKSYKIVATGNISLAGRVNPVQLTMAGYVTGDHVEVTGEKELLMSDFGVEPPTMMFGRIKTDDKVIVTWDLLVKLKAE